MSDTLRSRIAAVVARELVQQSRNCGEYQTRDCYKVADAVIHELGSFINENGAWGVIDLLTEIAGPRCFAEIRQGTEPFNPRYEMTEGSWELPDA